ncbi:nitrilotriacetate monooxygenase, partial [Rhizobium johnstonii]
EYWLGGVDLTGYDYDGPLPKFPPSNQSLSTQASIYETARREQLTIRQFVERRLRADHTVVGTPVEVADHIQEWFEAG